MLCPHRVAGVASRWDACGRQAHRGSGQWLRVHQAHRPAGGQEGWTGREMLASRLVFRLPHAPSVQLCIWCPGAQMTLPPTAESLEIGQPDTGEPRWPLCFKVPQVQLWAPGDLSASSDSVYLLCLAQGLCLSGAQPCPSDVSHPQASPGTLSGGTGVRSLVDWSPSHHVDSPLTTGMTVSNQTCSGSSAGSVGPQCMYTSHRGRPSWDRHECCL